MNLFNSLRPRSRLLVDSLELAEIVLVLLTLAAPVVAIVDAVAAPPSTSVAAARPCASAPASTPGRRS